MPKSPRELIGEIIAPAPRSVLAEAQERSPLSAEPLSALIGRVISAPGSEPVRRAAPHTGPVPLVAMPADAPAPQRPATIELPAF